MAEPLIARFAVNGWEPRDLDVLDPSWVGAVTMKKEFTAGITGSSVALFVSSGDEGQRSYLAAERITGTLDGEAGGAEGSVTVHHGGLESSPEASFGRIVPGSGTGAFEGWAGTAVIHHDDVGAHFVIDLA